jgi:hypothetical protein
MGKCRHISTILTTVLVGGKWLLHANAALPPGEIYRYLLDRKLAGPQSWTERCGEQKNLAIARNRTPRPLVHSPSLYWLNYCFFFKLRYSGMWLNKVWQIGNNVSEKAAAYFYRIKMHAGRSCATMVHTSNLINMFVPEPVMWDFLIRDFSLLYEANKVVIFL